VAIAPRQTREEKLKWLMRPFWWAIDCGTVFTAPTLYFWYQGDNPTGTAFNLLAIIVLMVGGTFWGIMRLRRATRGY
jgi:hypothetical protein